ncbi:ABC transporter ATP-binding protein [Shewanella sp. CG12_big_fil_rev_8_21_14_0_65_47_15]|uniref:ABC transporter ATP-binding protein n=1 Tax=Shewanella sp. CG12_big_fil_rev_8_21_14_0_65_47_15 TaxID=1975537 RepID=UPI0025E1C539|nr:ABC transporter ATP-binding protein [Shewanella sp. CG12_big_fil_rev_8_21_14_0_65_47_15]
MPATLSSVRAYLASLWQTVPKLLLLAFGLLLLGSFTEGIGILMLVPVVNLMSDPSQTLPPWLASLPGVDRELISLKVILPFFLILLLTRSALVYWREMAMTQIRLHTTDELRKTLFESMLYSTWSQRINSQQHQELEQLTNGVNRVGMATFYILKMLTTVILLVVYAAVSILIAPLALLIACAVGAMVLLMFRRIFKQAAAFGMGLTNSNKQLYQRVMFFLNGMKTVKACAYEPQQLDAFVLSQQELRENQQAYQHKTALQQLAFQGVSATLLCLLVYLGFEVWQLGVAELIVLIVMFSRMMPMLSDLQGNAQRLLHMLSAFDDIEHAIASNRQGYEANQSSQIAFPQASLAFDNVSFAYPGREPLLKNRTIEFPLNKITLLKGPSGQGKTTIIDILATLLTPSEGAVMLDGVPLGVSAHHSWRQQISYLSQEPFLFDGSIRDNILWGEYYSDDEIWQTLQLCCAAFVADLPLKLDTAVGERGVQLSGGQRQRLVLARALIRKRPLLILDEATNALDSETEKQIFLTLQQQRHVMTIVLVSHSEQAEAFADKSISLSVPF